MEQQISDVSGNVHRYTPLIMNIQNDAIKKKWDERSVEKLKNIDISVSKCTENKRQYKKYDKDLKIGIMLDNHSAHKLRLGDLIMAEKRSYTNIQKHSSEIFTFPPSGIYRFRQLPSAGIWN